MKRILMVCLGNICRSPMAEGILKKRIAASGIQALVDSAGTSAWHQGEAPDERAIEICLKYGTDIRKQRSRPFTRDDFSRFDMILAMDRENRRNVLALARTPEERSKVSLIMELVHPGREVEVPDPWYGNGDGFERVYRMLD
ncbi:MAG TPA: low molecular weight protein-tyrosine-phosphatase, partial [Bacteroidales bacterium]|nr:low molecular weight protein-tyrosine-phosphatase [Bacteroidales bacterium]